MRCRSVLVVGGMLLASALAACAPLEDGGAAAPAESGAPSQTSSPPVESVDAAAREQARSWLEAAVLPPGAVRSDTRITGFASRTAWPCVPVEELEAFWSIPDSTVAETANWLMAHPTADLVTTAVGPVSEDPEIDFATVGYIPEEDAQEGMVYTIAKTDHGVAVRAEIAALTESAACPTLPGGASLGAPGQG